MASRDSLPWAYMIPIEDIMDDIKDYLGDQAEIHLPSEAEIKTMRHTREEMSLPGPRQNLDVVSSCKSVKDEITNFPHENAAFGVDDPDTGRKRGPHVDSGIVIINPDERESSPAEEPRDSVEFHRIQA